MVEILRLKFRHLLQFDNHVAIDNVRNPSLRQFNVLAKQLAVINCDECTKHQFVHLLTATFKDLDNENSKNYKR